MGTDGQETEVKFYVLDQQRIITRLQELKARLIQERVHERNIRFDWPDASLKAQGRVLRLRQDTQARLTYKGPSTHAQGVMSRREIEFSVESFESAWDFLGALGYHKLLLYEKYRATYELHDVHVMLDELPYGDFLEIEGENMASIRKAADRMRLDWQAAIGTSYTALFDRARKNLRLELADLSFEAFKSIRVTAADLEIRPADNRPLT